jgi:hypothetical protein
MMNTIMGICIIAMLIGLSIFVITACITGCIRLIKNSTD